MFIRRRYAIDLGTDNTIVYEPSRGIIYNEPTCITFNRHTGRTICIGHESKKMTGKTAPHLPVIRPLSQGAVAHLDAAVRFLKHLIDMLMLKRGVFGPEIAVSVPFDLTAYEREAVRKAGLQSGASSVILIEDPYSAAVGAGIDYQSPKGVLLLDVGSGVTEISLLSCGGVVSSRSVRSAGWDFEQAIIRHFDETCRERIAPREAEFLKLQLSRPGSDAADIHAISRSDALPHPFRVSREEVSKALEPALRNLAGFVKNFMQSIPADFAPGIRESGLYLTGGSALLGGLGSHLEHELGLAAVTSRDPLLEIALGAGRIVEDRQLFSHFASR